MTDRLTLNLGLRYDAFLPPVYSNGRGGSYFDEERGQAVYPANAVIPAGCCLWSYRIDDTDRVRAADWNNFGPRFGFAYRLFGNSTVLRGGYGVYYDVGIDGNLAFGTGIVSPFFGGAPIQIDRDETNPGALLPIDQDLLGRTRAFALPATFAGFNHDFKTGLIQQWNFTLERQLRTTTSLALSYVGNKGDALLDAGVAGNFPLPGPGSVQARRPFPDFGSMNRYSSYGQNNYHSLQLKLDQRLWKSLSGLVAYTWAKGIGTLGAGNGNDSESSFYSNPFDRQADRSVTSANVPQRFVLERRVRDPLGRLPRTGPATPSRLADRRSLYRPERLPVFGKVECRPRQHRRPVPAARRLQGGRGRQPAGGSAHARALFSHRAFCRAQFVHLRQCGPEHLDRGRHSQRRHEHLAHLQYPREPPDRVPLGILQPGQSPYLCLPGIPNRLACGREGDAAGQFRAADPVRAQIQLLIVPLLRESIAMFLKFAGPAAIAACLAAFAALTAGSDGGAGRPIDIGSRLELFVDDYLISQMPGLALKLHEPRLEETVLKFDAPWEGAGNHYITVFKDGPRYRMYYRAVPGSNAPASGKGWQLFTCYAESDDGIHWTRPKLGIVDFQGSKENNIILSAGGDDWGSGAANFAPFKDSNPAALPGEQYKALGGIQRGLYAFVSPDGIRWSQKPDAPIMTRAMTPVPMINGFDSHNLAFWEAREQRYICYIRDQYLAPGTGERIRGIRRTTSKDFRNWTFPEWVDLGDTPADQFYTFSITPYFRAPHVYLAFPKRYLPFRDAELPKIYDAGRGKGLSDSVFMTSRDGTHWNRTFLEAFVRPGPDPLNWTDRSNYIAWGVVPTAPGEISLYVLKHFRLPTIHIRRGVLRTDGFVSVNAPYRGGELLTKPLVFRGRRLIVNYATSAAGSLRTEVIGADGLPVPGYNLTNSVELFGDRIDEPVRWDHGSDLGRLAGQPIQLRFVLKDADLYAFQFAE